MSQMEDRTGALETQRISTLLLAYALPSVVSQIIASVYNIVDRIFLGQCVGALAIAGLAITMPIMNIVHAFGSLVGVGSAARMSIVLGAKDVRWARRILGNSMYLTIAFGILFVTFGYLFMDRILAVFGASPDTISYAREYMVIVLPGMFLTTIAFNLTGLIRSSGYPKRAMWILAGGALLNIILDTVFIYALGWGIAGAAWATTISMACSALAAILHFVSPTSFIRFSRDCWSPRLYIFLNILSIGLSPFLMNVAASGVVALLNRQLIRYGNLVMPGGGDLAVGACGISNTFGALLVMFILGVCQGMQPIAGYNYGAGRQDRLKEVFTLTLKVNIMFGTAGALIGVLFPQTLLRVFTTDADLIRIGTPAMRYLLVMWGIIAFTITNSNFFQSIDKPWIAIVTSLSRQVIFLAPMIYILPPLYERLNLPGLTGIWMSCAVSDVLGAVLAGSLLLTQRHIFQPGYQAPPRRQRKAFQPSPGDEA